MNILNLLKEKLLNKKYNNIESFVVNFDFEDPELPKVMILKSLGDNYLELVKFIQGDEALYMYNKIVSKRK